MDISNPLKEIPQSRLLAYLMVAGLLPLLIVAFTLISSLDEIDSMQIGLENLQFMARQKERKQAGNRVLANNYRQAEPFYIDKELESLELLQSEIAALKKIANNPNFVDNESVRQRLERLTGSQNRIAFTDSAVQSTPQFKEVVEQLAHPVEVDSADVIKILNLIEGVEFKVARAPINRPQLILLEFKIDKKTGLDKNEVFLLNLKLLKREFT